MLKERDDEAFERTPFLFWSLFIFIEENNDDGVFLAERAEQGAFYFVCGHNKGGKRWANH